MTAIEREINKIYLKVFNEVYNKNRVADLSRGSKTELYRAVSILESSEKYNEFAEKFSKALAKKGIYRRRGLWRKYYEAAKKLHYVGLPKTWTEFENQQMKKAISKNFQMIKSIPREVLKLSEHQYANTLIEEVAKGKIGRGSFYEQLKAHGAKNAKVIARTETAKLQSSITENRARDLGSVVYKWLSSNDIRTRPSHRAMNGVIVFWRNDDNEKPLLDKMYGNAGEFPNCRCAALPQFREKTFTQNNYNVYDYRTHKIIKMSKNELLTAIRNGGL